VHGFLCFWIYWLGIVFVFPSGAIFYAAMVLGPAADNRVILVGAALLTIWLSMGAGIFGVRTGRWVQAAGTAAVWITGVILVVGAILLLSRQGSVTEFHLTPELTWGTVSFFSVIAFAMSGMEMLGLMGGEIRDPARSMPRAAAYASLLATVFYAVATAAVLVMLRPADVNELTGLSQAAVVAGQALGGAAGAVWLPRVFSALMCMAAIGAFSGVAATVSRMPFAAGVDHLLPAAFGRLHPRWASPHISLLAFGAIASLLLVAMQLGDTARGAYQTLVSLMVIVGFLPYVYIFWSAWKCGRKLSAVSGLAVTCIAIAAGTVPTGAIGSVWIFEVKLALGTLGTIVSGWLLYRRGARLAARARAASVVVAAEGVVL
jgi:APA family basic amino acid/polyamine antiporter